MTNIKYPCEECICIPICRHKKYTDLVRNCSILISTLYVDKKLIIGNRRSSFNRDILILEATIKPVSWETFTHRKSFVGLKSKNLIDEKEGTGI